MEKRLIFVFLSLFLSLSFVFAIPSFILENPTPLSNIHSPNTTFEFNFSILESNLKSLIYSWNSTNYTIYNNSLVLMYNFDNRSSLDENYTKIVDLAQHSNNATAEGNARYISTGKHSGAYSFDGLNGSRVSIPYSAELNSLNYTVSLWVNMSGSQGSYRTVISSRSDDNDATYIIYGSEDNFWYFWTGTGSGWDRLAGTPIALNEWTHIAAVHNTTHKFLYINGELVNTSASATTSKNIGSDIYLGNGGNTGTEFFLNGSIDELRIWNRSLNEQEIYQSYISNLEKTNYSLWNFQVNQSQNATQTLPNGTYTYRIHSTDTSDNLNSTTLRSITVETIIPIPSFESPTPTNNTENQNNSFIANFSIAEENLKSLIYSWNSTNYSIFDESSILWMNFDDYTRLNDSSIYSNNGTVISGTINYISSGVYGGAYQFEKATTPQISFGDIEELDGTSQFTIASWVKYDNLYDFDYLFTKWNGTLTTNSILAGTGGSGVGGANDIFLRVTNGSTAWAHTNEDLLDTEWHHWIMVYDGTQATNPQKLKFYFDGISRNLTYNTDLPETTASNDAPLVISGLYDSVNHINGSIDEFRLYNRSLNETEAYLLYTSNLHKYDESLWSLYINQSLNATSELEEGQYTYQLFSSDLAGNENQTNQRLYTVQGPDSISPLISFVSPTPENENLIANTSFIVNSSIIEENLRNLNYIWNNTNYTIYDDSLILMYNFDNLTALGENYTYIVDHSNSSLNGTIENLVSLNSTGKYGGAAHFNGINTGIDFPDVTLTDDFTISFWWNIDYGSFYGPILSKDTSGSENKIAHNNDGSSFFIRVIDGGSSDTSVSLPSEKEWHMITITRDSSDKVDLYINANSSTRLFSNTAQSGASTWSVLGRAGIPSSQYINGSIDELRIWNRSLNEQEIYQSYISNLNKVNKSLWYFYANQSFNKTAALSDLNYSYSFFSSDTFGNQNSTLRRNINIDSTPPLISVFSGTSSSVGFGDVSSNASAHILYISRDLNLDSCWYSNDTHTLNTTLDNCANITSVTWSEGQHNVTIYSNDTLGSIENISFNFEIDLTPPAINITSPVNNSNTNITGLNITYTTSGTNISSCWYSNDTYTTNITISGCTNITSVTWSSGQHNLTLWINDTVGNTNSSSLTFNISTVVESGPESSSSEESSPSSGGSSGGGGGGPFLQERSPFSDTLELSTFLTPDKSLSTKLKEDKNTGIREFEITAKNWINGKIYVMPHDSLPENCVVDYTGDFLAYKALEINSTFDSSDIGKARLRVAINKSWIYSNNISLIKAVKCAPYYEELDSSYIMETEEEGIYDIYSTGFSTLAILGTYQEEKKSSLSEMYTNEKNLSWTKYIWVALIVFLVLALAFTIHKRKGELFERIKFKTRWFTFEESFSFKLQRNK